MGLHRDSPFADLCADRLDGIHPPDASAAAGDVVPVFTEDAGAHVAPGLGPFVVLLREHRVGQAGDSGPAGGRCRPRRCDGALLFRRSCGLEDQIWREISRGTAVAGLGDAELPGGAVSTRCSTGRSLPGKERTMNETSSAGLRLPVQGLVYRTRAHGPVAGRHGLPALSTPRGRIDGACRRPSPRPARAAVRARMRCSTWVIIRLVRKSLRVGRI